MKNTITRVDALNYAINNISAIDQCTETGAEVVSILEKIRDQIAKPRKTSDSAKANAKAKRANARAEIMAQVLPVLRTALTDSEGVTAKELYERCVSELPSDFTANKVQYVLLHELADEVVKTETKGKPNTYAMKG